MTELAAVGVILLMGVAGILSIFGREAADDVGLEQAEPRPRRQVA